MALGEVMRGEVRRGEVVVVVVVVVRRTVTVCDCEVAWGEAT